MTVVSTPPLTGRRSRARRRAAARRRDRALGGRRRSRAGARAGASAAPRAPRRAPRAATSSAGHDPGGDVEAPSPRARRGRPAPYSSTSAALICALVLPCGDLLADERALLVGDRRRWRRRAAVPHSTHITSSSMSGSDAFGVAASAAAPTEQQRSTASRTALTPAPPAASGRFASSHACVDRPAAAARRSGPCGRSGTSPGSR